MKKVLAIIVAIVVIAALIVGIVFISNRNDDPVEPTTPGVENTTPTESTKPEPELTKPRDPNVWSLYEQEDPEFYDIRIDDIEKEGIDFITQQASSPHFSIEDIQYIFETNEFLKKDIKLNKIQGTTERWKQDQCALYDDEGMRIYDPVLTVIYDEKLVGANQDGETITVTCRTEYPMFANNNIIIVECENMPLDKYHKILKSILTDMFDENIATYLIYAKDKDGQYEPVSGDNGREYDDTQCLTEIFHSDITELQLSRTIEKNNNIAFKVAYHSKLSNKAFFLSELAYQTKYDENAIVTLKKMFPNLSYTGNTNNQISVLPEYFAINTSKSVDKSEMQFWTFAHEPESTNKEKWVCNFTAIEDEKQTSYPDTLNVLGMATYDKNSNVESLSLKTHAWTYVEIKDGMTQEQAIQKAIEIAQKQIKFVYNADVTIKYENNTEGLTIGEVINYSHALTEKTMQLTPKWTFEVQTGVVLLYWDVAAETVQ